MRSLFGHEIQSIAFGPYTDSSKIDARVAAMAQNLANSTPDSRPMRVTGTLDMIRQSTRTFGLRLESGEEIRGVMEANDPFGTVQEFFGTRLMVFSRAVYRPSGKLLRVDAKDLKKPKNHLPFCSEFPALKQCVQSLRRDSVRPRRENAE